MSKKTAIVDQAAHQDKRPWDLTTQEVLQLMQAFTADKTCILEDDALTLCRWAQAHKRGAYALDLVLAGRVRVEVQDATVRLCLPPARRQARHLRKENPMADEGSEEQRDTAYWDLQGLVGKWMDEYGQDRGHTILYLTRIVAQLQAAMQARNEWRLTRIEQVLELPAEPSHWLDDAPAAGDTHG